MAAVFAEVDGHTDLLGIAGASDGRVCGVVDGWSDSLGVYSGYCLWRIAKVRGVVMVEAK